MAFVTNLGLMEKAKADGYAVGAFNINNLEITLSVVEAAVAERSPVIIAVSPGAMKYAGVEYLSAIAKTASELVDVPLSLHLDHGLTLEHVRSAIDNGFSSVMIDGSKLAFEENIRLTREVSDIAHSTGISVEGELGKLVGVEDAVSVTDREASMTDPDKAEQFVEDTDIDALAVAIGNAHGWYKGRPQLDFERLREIRSRVKVPLVLHGASGIPDDMIKEATSIGVDKINIDTEVRNAFRQAVAGFVNENPEEIDPRKILTPARDAMRAVVQRKMKLFGSSARV